MDLELDEELFPPRRSLVGLRFAGKPDYDRAKRLIGWDFSFFHELYPGWQMVVVRRVDAHKFAEAGLEFTEVDQIDDDELSPDEIARRDRALIDSWKKVLFEGARDPR